MTSRDTPRHQLSLTQRLRQVETHLPLDAKRKPAKQTGLEGWYPYYAGYTEAFARGVLCKLADNTNLTVLDPWNGSGTTTKVALDMGHRAIGFDLNPVANLVATAKLVHPDDALHTSGLARRLASAKAIYPESTDPLLPWMAPSVVAQYRAIEQAILSQLATNAEGIALRPETGSLPPLAAFMLLALVRTARESASVFQGTNPTWTRPAEGRRKTIRKLAQRWLTKLEEMACELAEASNPTTAAAQFCRILPGDARALPLDDGYVDLVLTSPPYCTRIDYVVSSAFELAALGIGRESDTFGSLRLASMGTPLVRGRPAPEIPEEWPATIRRLLVEIRAHPSKASSSYYYKTFWQYFADARASLSELLRVIRPGGLVVFVVQTSYYKELCVDLPALYVALGESLGFKGTIVGEAAVRHALAQIHPHSLHHRQQSLYREAVVALEKAA